MATENAQSTHEKDAEQVDAAVKSMTTGRTDCYEAAFNHEGPVRATLRAVALRGKGVQLIDLNRLDEAEQIFERSLKLDPNNPVALNELRYIATLRRGAPPSPKQTVAVGGQPLACAICGNPLDGKGKVHNIDGRLVVRCDRCAAMLPATGGSPGLPAAGDGLNVQMVGKEEERKKWWKFWKKGGDGAYTAKNQMV